MAAVMGSASVKTPASVLVVAPHPDDEAIGCGGAICLHLERRQRVDVVFLTSGERGLRCGSDDDARAIREAEALAASEVLGVNQVDFLRLPDLELSENIEAGAAALARLIEARPARIIYLPHPAESHPDHAASVPIVGGALTKLKVRQRPELWAYEVWSPMDRYDWIEDVTPVMPIKLRAIGCYRSQLASLRYDEAVRALNHYRGLMAAGSEYAEAFRYVASRAAQTQAGSRTRRVRTA